MSRWLQLCRHGSWQITAWRAIIRTSVGKEPRLRLQHSVSPAAPAPPQTALAEQQCPPIHKHASFTEQEAGKVAHNLNRLQGKGKSKLLSTPLPAPHPPCAVGWNGERAEHLSPFCSAHSSTGPPSAFPAPRSSFTNASCSDQPYIRKGRG